MANGEPAPDAIRASQDGGLPPASGLPSAGGLQYASTLPHASVLHLLLRRLRTPLLVVLAVFAVSIAGFTLIPGVDDAGRATAPLSFFHAFYFVTYTA